MAARKSDSNCDTFHISLTANLCWTAYKRDSEDYLYFIDAAQSRNHCSKNNSILLISFNSDADVESHLKNQNF